ncbi:hypothetical protein [Facklamia sp. 7083-14-GEN3]|uniref:hypothetical protein n=1 Tax=Facklamia sp. 7083-14-GEN3 TaxID=2973478 RepID=UPI00215D5CA3|nr:hypothetical protein [Facklamia sp. 7083-14-GEN3]MCR8968461.1 hypothetical protein [Facklamia sp. 7083-14-GEN3]
MKNNQMSIEIARPDERMSPSGKALLKSLSNESLPIIDLVVRESFQNSLDAKLNISDQVKVDVTINEIQTSKISKFFAEIDQRLNQLFPSKSKLVAIRDTYTTGLTGEFNTDNVDKLSESNIYKLIYGINMNQEQSDAGGSWGLGKTSFYRIGCGIVIYYTRIKTNSGRYEERLAACLIENSDLKNAIMPENNRGIAWWGEKYSDNPFDKSYPITDKKFIRHFLNTLNIASYEGDETGTTAIIPFINEENLIYGTQEAKDTEEDVYYWEKDLEKSFDLAIKRWYFPRLMNIKYKKKFNQAYLISFVNNNLVQITNSRHTFSYFKKLYDSALVGESLEEGIIVKPIYLKSMGMANTSIPTGYLAYTKVSTEDLGMSTKGELSPLAYIGMPNSSNRRSGKILAYCRKPGMVVEYVTDNADWLSGFNVENEKFVFAMFVPNSDGPLHSKYSDTYETLENYLRDTENADHANWDDKRLNKRKITIISRIKKQVAKDLSEEYGEQLEAISSGRANSLSRKYGKKFLPNINYGKAASAKVKSKTKKKDQTAKKSVGIILKSFQQISQDVYKVECNLKIAGMTVVDIKANVVSTDREINQNQWINTFGSNIPFPFEIDKVSSKNIIGIRVKEDRIYNITKNLKEVPISLSLKVLDSSLQPTLTTTAKKLVLKGD